MAANLTASGGAEVVLDEDSHDLRVPGHGIISKPKHRAFGAPVAVVGAADIDSLAAAMRNPDRCCADLPEQIYVAECSVDDFDEDFYEAGPVAIEVGDDGIFAVCRHVVGPDRGTTDEYSAWLGPAARRHDCRVSSVRLLNEYGAEDDFSELPLPEPELAALIDEEGRRRKYLEVQVAPLKPMVASQLLAAGRDVYALLVALRAGALTAVTARDLLLAKLPHLFVGVPESEWFEAKGQPYALNAPTGMAATAAKIELAQDVARFANGQVDALLVIGLQTKSDAKRDVVSKVGSCDPSVGGLRR